MALLRQTHPLVYDQTDGLFLYECSSSTWLFMPSTLTPGSLSTLFAQACLCARPTITMAYYERLQCILNCLHWCYVPSAPCIGRAKCDVKDSTRRSLKIPSPGLGLGPRSP